MIAEAPPDEIRVRAGRSQLVLVFASGSLAIGAPRLRAACRCADCRRERIDREADPMPAAPPSPKCGLVGDHALNIVFSDGHDRGIYPWSYLRELAPEDLRPEAREAG